MTIEEAAIVVGLVFSTPIACGLGIAITLAIIGFALQVMEKLENRSRR